MAFHLDKDESSSLKSLIADLKNKRGLLEDLLGEYNYLVSSAASFRDEVVARLQEEFDDKSENWQEGDAGQEAQSLISSWEDTKLDEVEVDLDHADTLENLE